MEAPEEAEPAAAGDLGRRSSYDQERRFLIVIPQIELLPDPLKELQTGNGRSWLTHEAIQDALVFFCQSRIATDEKRHVPAGIRYLNGILREHVNAKWILPTLLHEITPDKPKPAAEVFRAGLRWWFRVQRGSLLDVESRLTSLESQGEQWVPTRHPQRRVPGSQHGRRF